MNISLSRARHSKAFALVVTVSLLVLLSVIALGFLSLSAVTLRSGSQEQAQMEARANARLALQIAIGELQKQMGPDQRVSARADILPENSPNPMWTGVWQTDDEDAAPVYMVSGTNPNPTIPLDAANSVSLHSPPKNSALPHEVRVPLQDVSGQHGSGRMAWWVGDEGVKARVNIDKPGTVPATPRLKLARSQSALQPGLHHANAAFLEMHKDANFQKTRIISLNTLDLASDTPKISKELFHDVTVGGHGLPVNVTGGKLKTDLSLIFDSSQQTKSFANAYLGATPTPATTSGHAGRYNQFSITDPGKFYLSEAIAANIPSGIGPNWGNLWNYAQLWKVVQSESMPWIPAFPPSETDIRRIEWLPYRNSSSGSFRRDLQHVNNPILPVVSTLQLGFRLSARDVGGGDYRLQLEIKPLVGLWNPYNVRITGMRPVMDWEVYPYFRYGTGTSTGTPVVVAPDGAGSTAPVVDVWMREQWPAAASGEVVVRRIGSSIGSARFRMRMDGTFDMQPGEHRLFSVSNRVPITGTSNLSPSWSEAGAYVFEFKKANGQPAVIPGELPDGSDRYVWIEEMFFDDMQHPDFWSRYQVVGAASRFPSRSGLAIRAFHTSEHDHLTRWADLWNPGRGGSFRVPEQIVSDRPSTPAAHSVKDLAVAGGHEHIATWKFNLRTTTQMELADQRIRGWIDANPRSLAINQRWEGDTDNPSDRYRSGNLAGRYFSNAFMGGSNDGGSSIGDGGPKNRGLVAQNGEGGENIEPQIGSIARYQGLGGASNTNVGGQPNVAIYDVPRSPLVSIGQFQHAHISRYNFEPGFVIGNSYANQYIPLYKTKEENVNGIINHDISDTSYDINKRLWDEFYFSTLGVDYIGGTATTLDQAYGYNRQSFPLANPRLLFEPKSSDTSLDLMVNSASENAPEVISSRVQTVGAFNINSTSITAWKAVLSSMSSSELPVINPVNNTLSWQEDDRVRFNRFGQVSTPDPYTKSGQDDKPFWLGWRSLDASELDELAESLVNQIKARGPFLSLADFVNRDPDSSEIEHQRKGPLQAALDDTLNRDLPGTISDAPASTPDTGPYSGAAKGESQAVGSAGYVMQGDVLQSLGPILQARSDYFQIRSYGEALDANGRVIARAWCEAYVQRQSEYVDYADADEVPAVDLNATNKKFGRQIKIVSFRWLNAEEI